MHCKLIVLFLFFECTVFVHCNCAATKRIHHDEIAAFQRNQSDVAEFVLVNPKQIQHAESVIKQFLIRITGSIAQPIILKSSFLKGGNLQETINEICKIIRGNIMKFAQTSGLTISASQYERTPENFKISNDWFTESIIQGSLLLHDLVKLGEEIRFRIDRYFKIYNITLYMEKLSSRTESFKFLNTINKIAEFNERLFNCLQSVKNGKNSLSFDLIRTFANLTKDSPNITVKSFKFSLNRAFSYSIPDNGTNDEQLYVLLCYSLVERVSHHGDCIKELRRLVACMSLSRRDSNGVITHTLPPWLSNMGHLSDCQIVETNNGVNINCNRKLPRTTVQQVKYIYENILDRRISERSPLHRVANELGNVLSKSTWGRQLTYDVCQCFVIYEEGRRKLNALSKNATKNKKVAIRFEKLSTSLNVYKNEILREMMRTISNFHRSALEVQKFLTRAIKFSFKESWQNHIRILNYLFEWIKKLLELFGYTNLDDTDVNVPTTTTDVDVSITTTDADVSITTTDISPPLNITDLTSITPNDNLSIKNNQRLVVHHKKNQIKKETDAAFERLLKSMNDVNKMQSRNSNSTVAHMANNLLLIVIFMETLSFISTLFSLGKYKDETNSEASTEEWDSSERKRRSLFSTDFAAQNDTIKNDSLVMLKAFEKIANIYNKENINYTRNIPVDITNNVYSLRKGYSNKYKKQ